MGESILPLDGTATARARVGGKAAGLAGLAGVAPIPDGFCITPDGVADGDAIARAYAALGDDVVVAVRSSGVDEDDRGDAFAGIHESVLNVRGADALLAAVEAVVASGRSPQAEAYRRARGLDPDGAMAVLVQRMIDADAAAIVFTADPMGGEHLAINATRGLGDALAAGEAAADTYRVRRDGTLLDARLAGDARVLDDEQLASLAAIALDVERALGSPADIELACAQGRWYLLQARPITVAFPVTWETPTDAEHTWDRDDVHFPSALSALGADYVRMIWRAFDDTLRHNDAPWSIHARIINGYTYVASIQAADPADAQQHAADATRARIPELRRHWDETYLPAVLDLERAMLDPAVATMDPAALADHWRGIWTEGLPRVWGYHFMTTFAAYRSLGDLADLVASFELDISRAEALHLIDGRCDALHQVAVDLAALAARPSDGHDAELERFLERHGHLGPAHDDLRLKAWREDHAAVARELERNAGAEDPETKRARLLAEADARAESIRARLSDEDRARFDESLALARDAGPLAEDHNYHIDRRTQAGARALALAVGQRLVDAGVFDEPEDALHLHHAEVEEALREPRDLRALVISRRDELARWERLCAPSVLGVPREQESDGQDDGLRGVGASLGIGRGPARIVRSAADLDRVQPGDVLVCRAANTSWVPVFGIIAALVTDLGELLAHASVVAREMGVPAVVGVTGASDRIAEGTILEVDGERGVVRALHDAS